MAATTPATCVYCRRNIPHERHITPLEYAKLFGGSETYAYDVRILGESRSDRVGQDAAKERILAS